MAEAKEGAVPETVEDLEALFGFNVEEVSPAAQGEGAETPRPEPPAGKETPREGAGAPEGQTPAPTLPPQAVPKERFDEVYDRARKYEEWEPIIKLFEEDPATARRFILERVQSSQPQAPSQPPAQTYTPEQVREYWTKRFEEDPAGTMTELLQRIVDERLNQFAQHVAPIRQSVAKLAVRDFKKAMREEDPLFNKYERIFDSIVAQTDPALIEAYPDQVLSRARAMAFGMWADTQRKKIGSAPKTALPREKPTGAEVDVTGRGAPAPSVQAKPKRAPTKEEEFLAERYGIPLETLLEDEEEEAVFSRR